MTLWQYTLSDREFHDIFEFHCVIPGETRMFRRHFPCPIRKAPGRISKNRPKFLTVDKGEKVIAEG